MAAFTDTLGRAWRVRLVVSHLAELRELGVEIAPDKIDERFGHLLYTQPEKLVQVLWTLCREQAETLGVAPEQFGAGFDGDTLGAAGEAFAEALTDFFPRRKIGRAMAASLQANLAAIDDRVVASISKAGAGNSSASSAATPTG